MAFYLRCRAHNFTGLDIQAFLRHLVRHLRGPIDLLWDRGPIHRRREVRDFLITHPRLDMHYFPAYAPELKPAEYCGRRPTTNSPTEPRMISASFVSD